jgi:hypothetical protein
VALSGAALAVVAYAFKILKDRLFDRSVTVGPTQECPDPPLVTDDACDLPAATGSSPAPPDIDASRISDRVKRAYQLVPPIGEGWRWYDVPYRLLWWLLTSWRRKLLPWQLRSPVAHGLNFLSAFDHYERLKVESLDDPLDNLIVPKNEELTQGAIWVVEFFPPSLFSQLHRALEKNGWDKPKQLYDVEGSNAERVTRARRGRGFTWSRVGAVAHPKSGYSAIDTMREALPDEFGLIQLTAVQLGQSVTAVTAFFRLSQKGREALNKVWKAQHEPIFEWRGFKPPNAESRHFAAIRAGQRERKRLHDLARTWLADRCPGYFAATEAKHPVVDFNMFAQFDPTSGRPTREMGDSLRALGMQGDYVYNYVSPQLPGGVFVQGESLRPNRDEDLSNCWGLTGAHKIFSELNDQAGYGGKPYSAETLAAMSDDAIRDFLLNVAVVRYTEQLRETFSDARDTAQTKHRNFKPKQVEHLRRELLHTSLDLPVVARDTALLWEPAWRRFNGIAVEAVPVPDDPYPAESFDLIEFFRKTSAKAFKQHLKDDSAYRDVLATASALGASAATNRLGKRALVVSATSLIVSTTAVLTTNDAALWHHVISWFSDFWNF